MLLTRTLATPSSTHRASRTTGHRRGPAARRRAATTTMSGNGDGVGAAAAPQRRAKTEPIRPAIVALDLDATVWSPELYQLWGGAPFKRCSKSGHVQDRNGERLVLMGHAPYVLSMLAAAQGRRGAAEVEEDEHDDTDDADALLLSDRGWEATELAYVSRTEHGDWAADALRCFSFPLPGAAAPSSPSSSSARRAARALAASSAHHPPNLHALAAHHEIYPGSKIAHFKRIRERTGVDYADMIFFDNEAWNVKEVERLGVVSVHCPQGLTRKAWEQGLRLFAERKRLSLGEEDAGATTTSTTRGRRKGQQR